MADNNLKPDESDEERVEFFCDLGGPVINAEAFLTAFVVHFYKPEPGYPNEPARILAAEDFWKRAHSLLEGVPFDREVAATQALEELRCAVEEAVRAGRLIPRYEDTLAMRAGMRGRRKYARFHRVFFERVNFMAFVRELLPTVAGGPIDTPAPSAPDAAQEGATASNPALDAPGSNETPAIEGSPVKMDELPARDTTPGLTVAPARDETPLDLIGPGSPLWKRKCEKLRTPWDAGELADLLRLHVLQKERGVRDATAKLAGELGVTPTAIRDRLAHARESSAACTPGEVIRDGKRKT